MASGKLLLGLFIAGATLLVFAGVAQTALNSIVRSVITSSIPITSPSSELYGEWSDPSAPLYMQYYFWNVTNAWDVTYNGSLPNVELVGPFTYEEKRIKSGIEWVQNGDAINYTYTRMFYPIDVNCTEDQFLSEDVCTLPYDTVIAGINIPLMALGQTLTQLNTTLVTNFFNGVLKQSPYNASDSLFVNHTVSEWVFGYEDDLLLFLHKIAGKYGNILPSAFIQLQANDSSIYTFNSTVYTGEGDLDNVLKYAAWAGNEGLIYKNGTDELQWTGCVDDEFGNATEINHLGSMINGSEGFQFPPFLDHTSLISVYTEDLKRSSFLRFNSTTSLLDINLLRFVIVDNNFDNATLNPYNCAFSDYGPSGVLNMTALLTAPVFASLPHFYKADPYFIDHVTGMSPPIPEEHDTFLDVEPWTGATMRAHQRLQVSVQMLPTPGLHITDAIADIQPYGIFVPVMYADENGQLTTSLANKYKDSVALALNVGYYGMIGALAAGGLCIGAFIGLSIKTLASPAPSQYAYSLGAETDLLLPSKTKRGKRNLYGEDEGPINP